MDEKDDPKSLPYAFTPPNYEMAIEEAIRELAEPVTSTNLDKAVGIAMRRTGGKCDPKELRKRLQKTEVAERINNLQTK